MPPWRRKCEKDCSVIISCGAEGDEERVEVGGPWCLSVELVSVWRGQGNYQRPQSFKLKNYISLLNEIIILVIGTVSPAQVTMLGDCDHAVKRF